MDHPVSLRPHSAHVILIYNNIIYSTKLILDSHLPKQATFSGYNSGSFICSGASVIRFIIWPHPGHAQDVEKFRGFPGEGKILTDTLGHILVVVQLIHRQTRNENS